MYTLFNDIYKGKKVFVTGHTGFKGSWLSIWLHLLGAEVAGFSLDPYTEQDNFIVSKIGKRIKDIRGDIRDYDSLYKEMHAFQPDIVFHLAAQPLVRLSYDLPKDTYDINVGGTVNVLECIRNLSCVKAGIMITSDKCYENREHLWGYRECDPLGGYDPYSSSKGAAETIISGYRNSFFNPDAFNIHGKSISSVRAGNVFGGGDWSKDRLIPDCIRAIRDNNPVKVRNPYSTRPWQHVLEPLCAYLHLGSLMLNDGQKYADSWNIGPDFESVIEVKDIVDMLINHMGRGTWETNTSSGAPHEAKLLALDCTKAKLYLNWFPSLDINESLSLTADWYNRFENEDGYGLCIKNIDYYIKKAYEKGAVWTHG